MSSPFEMYPSESEAAVIATAESLMEETMKKYDPSHDALHVNRVRKTALALAHSQKPKPDLLVVELAALLHDVLDKKYVSAAEAADPYGFFRPFFDRVGVLSEERARLVVKVVENVSWTTEKKLRADNNLGPWHESCIELHCVQDADRLDAIGAFGILRTAAYSSFVNRPLHVSSEDPRYEGSSIGHFYDKLLHIQERLKTSQGKALGAERHQLMLTFLDAINKEYDAVVTSDV